MLKKIFTERQLSYFFHIAIIINNIGLLSDVIVYRYFPEYNYLKCINENLSNLSIFIICAIFVSQSLFIFIKNHHKLITHYKFLTITIEVCISVFFVLLLTTDNDLQEQFLIFCSSSSRANDDYKILIILTCLVIMLLVNFYYALKTSCTAINNVSVPKMLRSILRLVLQKYFIIVCFFLGIFHYEKMHTFATEFIHHTERALSFNLTLLKVIIPASWISITVYYLHRQHAHEQIKTKL